MSNTEITSLYPLTKMYVVYQLLRGEITTEYILLGIFQNEEEAKTYQAYLKVNHGLIHTGLYCNE